MYQRRERTPSFKRLNLDRRVAEGVAHARCHVHRRRQPYGSDTGDTERRPNTGSKIAHRKDIDQSTCIQATFTPPPISMESRAAQRGNTAPESVFPLFFVNRSPNSP